MFCGPLQFLIGISLELYEAVKDKLDPLKKRSWCSLSGRRPRLKVQSSEIPKRLITFQSNS